MEQKRLTPQERDARLKLAPKLLAARLQWERDRAKKGKETTSMFKFWISEDESKQLDNMTVRALAENPEATRAFFDQYGVLLSNDAEVIGIRDYVIVESPPAGQSTSSIHDWEENPYGFMEAG
jgi:hypothetical protein